MIFIKALLWTFVGLYFGCSTSSRKLSGLTPDYSKIIKVTENKDLVRPEGKTYDAWIKDFYQADEIWVIKSYFYFFDLLRKNQTDANTLKLLEKNFSDELPKDYGVIYSFYNRFRSIGGGYITLSSNIKNKIPSSVLRTVYLYLNDLGYGFSTISFPHMSVLIEEIDQWKTDIEQKKEVY